MATVVQVDDTDLRIEYSGDWFLGGNTAPEFNGTTHGAMTNGSTATFSFYGTSITFFGTISGSVPPGSVPSTASFVLDASSPVLVTVPQPEDSIYRHAYYASPQLSPAQHTLVVTALNADPVDAIWFDYFEYAPANNASSSSSSSSPTSALAVTAAVTESVSVTSPVLVPTIVFILILGALLLWRRRRSSGSPGYYGKREDVFESVLLDAPTETRIVSPYTLVQQPLLVSTPRVDKDEIMLAPPTVRSGEVTEDGPPAYADI